MKDFGEEIFDEIEVLIKVGELSSYRHDFKMVKAILTETSLMIIETNENEQVFKVFNYADIKAFKLKHNKTI